LHTAARRIQTFWSDFICPITLRFIPRQLRFRAPFHSQRFNQDALACHIADSDDYRNPVTGIRWSPMSLMRIFSTTRRKPRRVVLMRRAVIEADKCKHHVVRRTMTDAHAERLLNIMFEYFSLFGMRNGLCLQECLVQYTRAVPEVSGMLGVCAKSFDRVRGETFETQRRLVAS